MTRVFFPRLPALIAVCALAVFFIFSADAHGAPSPFSATHARPVPGAVMRPADIPEQNWIAGHRGVDLAARPGQAIHASRGGVVYFAGVVAGTPVVSVMHPDGLRTTYEPVRAGVAAGQRVRRGQTLGWLVDAEHTTRASQGLSWGAKVGKDTYIDPLTLLGEPTIVLKR
ncbi:M23 family metallopeptidase [Corynebacterium sp. 320]|uniref:M23 family metallopeptidase n=1 Tax=Corynebacterium TaxID=1716 RepID=UPI00125CAB9D|nr:MULTISPECIES: M23 family metallopeptidase [Corynebacterium]KAB1503818.1 M23 family metallopeptidase [Corynebacterium sp. 320]KAB1553083.1 M23 family metallopeptidase [Corynebacterium sp. 321]KAB1553699.1 M23 family metallopeptidase [Corynebacterium sp. 319]KAB3527954.1 M23 family metallopeptidase [Corynebacterium sp. 250]KAB3540558.1 M23 family metallopeptidase [Corynebacterium sp. 366]